MDEGIRNIVIKAQYDNIRLIKTIEPKFLNEVRSKLSAALHHTPFDRKVIGDLLRDSYKMGGWNSRRIARDQTNKLIGNFTMARQTHAGIEQYEWFTAMDERVRESHAQNHGSKFYWNKPPATGHPGEEILCRCVAMAVIDASRHRRAAMPRPANRPAPAPVVPPKPKPKPKPDFTPTGLGAAGDTWTMPKAKFERKRKQFLRAYPSDEKSDAGLGITSFTSTKRYGVLQRYAKARADGDIDKMRKLDAKYSALVDPHRRKVTGKQTIAPGSLAREYDAMLKVADTPTNRDVTLYRGVAYLDDDYKKLKAGAMRHDKFESFSFDPSRGVFFMQMGKLMQKLPSYSILFELDLPKGARGFVGVHDKLSRFRNEKEAFSIPGFKFEVVEIKENVTMKGPGTEYVKGKVTIVRLRAIPEEK